MVKLRDLLILLIAGHSPVAAQSAQAPSPADDAAVVAWVRQNAIPLRTVDAGREFADLAPLKSVLKDVRIIGLGEATHGSSEFQRVKHRLLEFLVKEMGFTAFAIEAAYSDAQPVNEYILRGTGDRAAVVTGLGYVAWDTEEFAAMLDWLRAYNRTVPDAGKVRFYGMDLYRNSVGRSKVQSALRRIAPELVDATDSLFRTLAEQEARWPLWDTTVIAGARTRLDTLASALAARRRSTPNRLPSSGWNETLKFIDVMQRAASLTDRSRHMAENLMYLVDHERPGTKFVVSAANYHIATDASQHGGHHLRRRYGEAYYALALHFDHGSYLSRSFPPPGDFKIGVMPRAAAGSLEWYLARAQLPSFFLDFHSPPAHPAIDAWLRTERNTHGVSWAYTEPATSLGRETVHERYDGVLFVSESTPTHPTASARKTVARKASF